VRWKPSRGTFRKDSLLQLVVSLTSCFVVLALAQQRQTRDLAGSIGIRLWFGRDKVRLGALGFNKIFSYFFGFLDFPGFERIDRCRTLSILRFAFVVVVELAERDEVGKELGFGIGCGICSRGFRCFFSSSLA